MSRGRGHNSGENRTGDRTPSNGGTRGRSICRNEHREPNRSTCDDGGRDHSTGQRRGLNGSRDRRRGRTGSRSTWSGRGNPGVRSKARSRGCEDPKTSE